MGSTSAAVVEAVAPSVPRLEGLTRRETEEWLRQFGPNDTSPHEHGSLVLELLPLFLNPLVINLLIASVIAIPERDVEVAA